MIKVQTFIGSPHKNGNTYSLVEKFDNGLNKIRFTSEVSYLYDYLIKPCDDCGGCANNEMECVISDDLYELYNRIDIADVLVFATPIYWFGPTAKTKLLIDKLRPYYYNKKLKSKKAILLLVAGNGEEDCDLTIEMFKRIFNILEINFIGTVISGSCDIGDVEKDIKSNEQITILLKKLEIAFE